LLQNTVDSLIQCRGTSEYGSPDICDEFRTGGTETSDNYLSQAAKPINQSLSENCMSNLLEKVFKDLCTDLDDIVDHEDIDEPPTPGFEDNPKTLVPSHTCKFQPSRSDECIPKIGEYVAMAMCRQKLHDDVLREWKSSFIDASLHQCLISWHASKNPYEPDGNEVTLINLSFFYKFSYTSVQLPLLVPSLYACLFAGSILISVNFGLMLILYFRKEHLMQVNHILVILLL
jgi:hypothetical protein